MASVKQFNTDVILTFGHIKQNVAEKEAMRTVCQIFGITTQELQRILKEEESWRVNTPKHSRHYEKVANQLFNI